MSQDNDPYSRLAGQYEDPPRGIKATLKQVGPGMILAGGVVGSGELIVTTKLGAVAGFVLLWFVIFSCIVKVIVQTELARYTICSGKTYLQIFNEIPGPAGPKPRWLTLGWLSIVLCSAVVALALYLQLGVGSTNGAIPGLILLGFAAVVVGSAWVIKKRPAAPLASDSTDSPPTRVNWFMWIWLFSMLLLFVNAGAILGGAGQSIEMAVPGLFGAYGPRVWAILVALLAGGLLLTGTYRPLENILTVTVISFTLLTIVCTILLQRTGYAVSWEDLREGLSLGFPGSISTVLLLTALAMYAGTGVAYGEMALYTYWCVEKGYARNTGEREPTDAWVRRARGWIRVMYTDAFLTMLVYTVSTVCFFLLGAAILYAKGLNPDGAATIATLSQTFTESLGSWSATVFIVGAFFVLFSTVLAGVAGTSRMLADALGVMGIRRMENYRFRVRFIRIFVLLTLVMYSIAFWLFENPPQMLIITSSILAAIFYPTLGLGVIYLRHRKLDPRVAPGRVTTVFLWVCGMIITVLSPGGIVLTFLLKYGVISIGP